MQDDKLQRIKGYAEHMAGESGPTNPSQVMSEWWQQVGPKTVLALIERLEAAEREKTAVAVEMHRIMCGMESWADIRTRQGLGGRTAILVSSDEAALEWQALDAKRADLMGHAKEAQMIREHLESNRRKAKEAS